MKEKEKYEQWTFKPQINEISSIIAGKQSILEKTEDAFRRKAIFKEQNERLLLKDCTFKPTVNTNIKVDSVYSSEN